jgi:hypothetical protein
MVEDTQPVDGFAEEGRDHAAGDDYRLGENRNEKRN